MLSLLGGRRRRESIFLMRSLFEINTQMDTHLWLMHLDTVVRLTLPTEAELPISWLNKQTKKIQDWSRFSFSKHNPVARGPEFYLHIKQICHFKRRRISLLLPNCFIFFCPCVYSGGETGERYRRCFLFLASAKLWYILLEAVLVFWVLRWWLFTHSLLVI